MAFTAFHCAVVWPLFILWPKKFDFIGLSVGATIPDILIPVLIFLPELEVGERYISHSLIGALTFDFALGLVVALFLVPAVIRHFLRVSSDPRWFTFAGVNVLEPRSKLHVVAYSVVIGTVSHVLLDIPYHAGNPVLYPLPSVLFPLDELLLWKVFSQGIIFLAFAYLAYRYWWRFDRSSRAPPKSESSQRLMNTKPDTSVGRERMSSTETSQDFRGPRIMTYALMILGFVLIPLGLIMTMIRICDPYCSFVYLAQGTIMVAVGLFLIFLSILFMLVIGQKKPAPSPPIGNLCTNCGGMLMWIPAHQRWYCNTCKTYR